MNLIATLARAPARPTRADLLLAVGLAAWALVEAIFGVGPGPAAGRVGYALAISAPLVVRRRHAFAVTVWLAAVSAVWMLHASRSDTGVMPFPAMLLAAFSVALYERRDALAAVGGVLMSAVIALAMVSGYYPTNQVSATNFAILSFILGCAWAAGWAVRRRARQTREALDSSAELARVAVADERSRIARELHDVVAHSVSIMAVQAGAAEELVGIDPERARDHMSSVRLTAREALREMRRLLDVLRDDEAAYVPQPGLDRLPELVAEARAGGVPVTLAQEGHRPSLSPGLELVVYRVVQESLTNVRKHAVGASATVKLRWGPDDVEIDVGNGAGGSVAEATAGNGAGHGLIGMRERVRLFGGRFQAGAVDGGGYRVHAWLPRAEEVR